MKLSNSNAYKFQQNGIDRFDLNCSELGRIEKIDILLRSTSTEPANWFLDKIEIEAKNGEIYEFEINRWISSQSDIQSFTNKKDESASPTSSDEEEKPGDKYPMDRALAPVDSSEPESSDEENDSDGPSSPVAVPALDLSERKADEEIQKDDGSASVESPLMVVPDSNSDKPSTQISAHKSTSPSASSSGSTSEGGSSGASDDASDKDSDTEKNEDKESVQSEQKEESFDIESYFETNNMLQILSSNPNNDDLNVICEKLRSTRNNVTFVTVRDTPLGDDKLEILVGGLLSLESLEFLNLNNCEITRRGLNSLNQIFRQFKDTLKALIVHGNNIGDDGLDYLVNRIIYYDVKIKSLDISDAGISDAGADALVKILLSDIPLESLEMTGNRNITPIGWAAIGAALGNNDKLNSLAVDYCELTSESLINLMQSIDTNRKLTDLDLEGNDIDNKGANQLIEIINKRLMKSENPPLNVTCRPGNLIDDNIVRKLEKFSSEY